MKLTQKIEIIKSIGLKNLLLILFNNRLKKFYAYKNSYFNIHKKSQINILESFTFNTKYVSNDPKKSFLIMKENSVLEINKFKIYSGANISINDNAILKLGSGYINHNVNIACFHRIEIGKNVAISENVVIRDSDNHQITSHQHNPTAEIIIKDNVWIGMNVIILKGVTIGEGSIIGAGSIVTKDIPPYSIAVGSPAKVIKSNVNWE